MSAPVRRGFTGLQKTSESGRVRYDARREETIVETGPYDTLRERQRGAGRKYEGKTVEYSELERLHGGRGRLTTVCKSTVGGAATPGNVESSANEETVYEVESAQLEKPLLSHKDFRGYAAAVSAWMNSGDPKMRAAHQYYDDNGDVATLDGPADELAGKIEKGIESYLVFSPVARVTSRRFDGRTPTGVGGQCGKRCDPPGQILSMVGGTWKWLKTGDRCRLSGDMTVERIEEWTAADEWDEDLYP